MATVYWHLLLDDEPEDTVEEPEFYPSVKKNTIYAMNLRPGPDGIVSVPAGDRNPTQPHGKTRSSLDWCEGNGCFGMTPHVGGIHLAQLRMAQGMADKVGDHEFADQCQKWRQPICITVNRRWGWRWPRIASGEL